MSDNVTAPFTDAVVATDDIGGVQYQRVKVTFGVDGAAADVSASDPLPVTVVAGVTTGLTDTQLRATPVPVSGTVAVTGTFWQATQPVSGTVAVTNAAMTNTDANTAAVKPAAGAFAVTPHDSNSFATATRGLYVGGAGNVVAIINGTAITFTAVPAGTILPIIATRVNSTSTTATAMVGLT